jgi:hypothetical protein
MGQEDIGKYGTQKKKVMLKERKGCKENTN